ncbi:MAG: hypothetical protein WD850_01170 [Candidatus Spechtbacterales bacterium]
MSLVRRYVLRWYGSALRISAIATFTLVAVITVSLLLPGPTARAATDSGSEMGATDVRAGPMVATTIIDIGEIARGSPDLLATIAMTATTEPAAIHDTDAGLRSATYAEMGLAGRDVGKDEFATATQFAVILAAISLAILFLVVRPAVLSMTASADGANSRASNMRRHLARLARWNFPGQRG